MNLLKKIFHKGEVGQQRGVKSDLNDLFSFDIYSLPDSCFNLEEDQVVSNSNVNKVYTRRLDTPECGLFDTVEVKLYCEFNNRSVSLITSNLNDCSMQNLEQLVNDCYRHYGEDDAYTPKGMFDEQDRYALSKKLWSGRMWTGPHHNPGTLLMMDQEKLEMVIWLK